jgi:tripeptide aminopeptidase
VEEEVGVIDRERLLQTFLTLVQIDSPAGQEAAIAEELAKRLRALDLEVWVDQVGNVLGRWEGSGEPLLLSAHLDTVAPGTGIRPIVEEGVVRSDGTTILGSDDKSGLAVILEVLTALAAAERRPYVEVALSVGEEIGLLGAKAMDVSWFRSRQALVLDAGGPLNVIVHGAPSSDKLRAVIHGRAAHAGVNPQDGINAIAIVSQAITQMRLGRLDEETTANIGTIEGGSAVNVVPDRVEIRGEVRSHDVAKLDAQVSAMRGALESAVAASDGAVLELAIERSYESYRLSFDTPIIQRVTTAMEAIDQGKPLFQLSGGGSDANILNTRGITAVPVSTGMQSVHTNQEHIAVSDMARCAELVLALLGQA